MNKPVSPKLVELLKEKGFEKPNPTIRDVMMWLIEKHEIYIGADMAVVGDNESDFQLPPPDMLKMGILNNVFNKIGLIYEWGYTISCTPKEHENEKRRSNHLKEIESFICGFGGWKTSTEAYENAIEYVLNNYFPQTHN